MMAPAWGHWRVTGRWRRRDVPMNTGSTFNPSRRITAIAWGRVLPTTLGTRIAFSTPGQGGGGGGRVPPKGSTGPPRPSPGPPTGPPRMGEHPLYCLSIHDVVVLLRLSCDSMAMVAP